MACGRVDWYLMQQARIVGDKKKDIPSAAHYSGVLKTKYSGVRPKQDSFTEHKGLILIFT